MEGDQNLHDPIGPDRERQLRALTDQFLRSYRASGKSEETLDALLRLKSANASGQELTPEPAKAEPSGGGKVLRSLERFVKRSVNFLAPNEEYPQRAAPILKFAPPGVHVSVGTERGFVHASLAGNTEALILADIDPLVNRYNEINSALLAGALSRPDYRRLRLNSNFEEWERRAANAPPAAQDTLADRREFEWWNKHVRSESRFKPFHAKPLPVLRTKFLGANYQHYDSQFARVKELADYECVSTVNCNLNEANAPRQIAESIAGHAGKLSVLDLSNAWQYIDQGQLAHLLRGLKASAAPESILLLTGVCNGSWSYMGFTFGEIFRSGEEVHLPPRFLKLVNDRGVTLNRYAGCLDGVKV